jgi:uncharacterized membrane protein
MAEHLSPKFRQALAGEIAVWRDEKLIADDLANLLLARYPAIEQPGRLITVLTILGSVLVGLGALLFIGANWYQIGPVVKLAIIFASIVAAHAAGWYFRFEPGSRPKLGTAFLLLGSLLYGAGIWLVAQIFNIDTNFSDGLLLWAAGSMLSAIVTRVPALGILTNLLAYSWLYSNSHADDLQNMLCLSICAGSTMGISYILRSPWSMALSILGAALLPLSLSHSGEYCLVAWGVSLFGGFLWHRRNWRLFEKVFMYGGIISGLAGLLAITCDKQSLFNGDAHTSWVYYFFALALAGLALAERGRKNSSPESIGAFLILISAYLIACLPSEVVRMLFNNANILGAIVLLAFTGLRRLRISGLVNTSVVFFVFLIIARYFDMFFSMLDRSAFFLAGGVVLLVAGAVAERSRRRLLEEFQS